MSVENFAAQVGADIKSLRQTTGTRNITSIIQPGYLASGQTGRLLVTRTGPFVNLVFDMLAFTGTSWVTLGNMGSGVRPVAQQPVTVFWGVNESDISETSALIIRSTGSLSFRQKSTGLARCSVTYLTADQFPAELPGTPA